MRCSDGEFFRQPRSHGSSSFRRCSRPRTASWRRSPAATGRARKPLRPASACRTLSGPTRRCSAATSSTASIFRCPPRSMSNGRARRRMPASTCFARSRSPCRPSEIDALIAARERNGVLIAEAFMVFYHPQWHKVRDLIAEGAIGTLRHVQGAFSYYNTDPGNMRNQPGARRRRAARYRRLSDRRDAHGDRPRAARVQATVERDPDFGTDRYASVRADFGGFETDLLLQHADALRGRSWSSTATRGYHRGGRTVQRRRLRRAEGHCSATSATRTEAVFRFAGVRQYRLEAEAFARRALGEDVPVFSLEELHPQPEGHRRHLPRRRARLGTGWETLSVRGLLPEDETRIAVIGQDLGAGGRDHQRQQRREVAVDQQKDAVDGVVDQRWRRCRRSSSARLPSRGNGRSCRR